MGLEAMRITMMLVGYLMPSIVCGIFFLTTHGSCGRFPRLSPTYTHSSRDDERKFFDQTIVNQERHGDMGGSSFVYLVLFFLGGKVASFGIDYTRRYYIRLPSIVVVLSFL